MKKFQDKLYEAWDMYVEEDLPPPPQEAPAGGADAAAAEQPPPAPAPEPDTIEDAPDDVSKMKMDMVESIRKAIIINPNDIDQALYAKLTNTTSMENLDDMEKTVQELVRNYYPDTELP